MASGRDAGDGRIVGKLLIAGFSGSWLWKDSGGGLKEKLCLNTGFVIVRKISNNRKKKYLYRVFKLKCIFF